MLNVLLDTNILHEEGLSSTRIQRIQRLIKSSDVKLIIPEIVINEFKSKRVEQANNDLEKIQSGLDSLQRKNITPKDAYPIKQAINFISHYISLTNNDVDKWMEINDVDIYKISNTSINELFSSYFSGTGAFRGKRKREDIPDAVIYDGIIKISQGTKLVVVVKDGVLFKAISKLENVESYSSLSELLEIPLLKDRIDELDQRESKVRSIIDTLNTSDCQNDITQYIEQNELSEIASQYENELIHLPYEMEDIEISSKKIKITTTDYIILSSPNYLGNKHFSLAIEIESKAEFSFYCEDEQYELLPYGYRKVLTKESYGTSGEVYVYGVLDVTLEGVVIIENIGENSKVNDLKLHLSYLGADRCEISCALEIESVRVNNIY